MGFLDRLFGRREEPSRRYPDYAGPLGSSAEADEQAIQRYRYMVRTAPPEAVEQAHLEAFSKLTPQQRAQVLVCLVSPAGVQRPTVRVGEHHGITRLLQGFERGSVTAV